MAKAATSPDLKDALFDFILRRHAARSTAWTKCLPVSKRRRAASIVKASPASSTKASPSWRRTSTTHDGCLSDCRWPRAGHFEIAAYGTLIAWADAMGHTEATRPLQQTLDEEKAADKALRAGRRRPESRGGYRRARRRRRRRSRARRCWENGKQGQQDYPDAESLTQHRASVSCASGTHHAHPQGVRRSRRARKRCLIANHNIVFARAPSTGRSCIPSGRMVPRFVRSCLRIIPAANVIGRDAVNKDDR